MSPVGAVFRTVHVPRLLGSALIGRLPSGMTALAIVLMVRDSGAGYGLAGVLTGLYAIGTAMGTPFLSRAVDRFRQPPVLLLAVSASTVGFLLFAVNDPQQHHAVAAGAVVLAGLATPPIEPCLRVLWSEVIEDAATVHAAYSVDAAAQEVIFTFGPLVVLICVAVAGPVGAMVATGLIGLIGSIVFATSAPARRWRGIPAVRHWAGPLRSVSLVRLLLAVVCIGLTVGIFTVAITAYAEQVSSRSHAAWLIAGNAAGALAGGIGYAMLPPARRPSGRIVGLCAALALGYVPLLADLDFAGTLPLCFISGIALPPVLACAFVLVEVLAPEGTATEGFAWMITAFGVGYAGGSALAGLVVESSGFRPAIVVAVCSGAASAVIVARRLDDRTAVLQPD